MSDSLPVYLPRQPDGITDTAKPTSFQATPVSWVGTRGDTWVQCDEWFDTMPGSLFQLTCVILFLAFMGGGQNAVAATYSHVLCACAFLIFSVFGWIEVCSVDMVVWGIVLVVINIGQVIYITRQSRAVDEILYGDLHAIYNKCFLPFNITPEMFAELVKIKGCQILKLEKGQKYAVEGRTPIERLSMLVSGKLTVSSEGRFLHSVTGNDFIDSPEWESIKSLPAKSICMVTISADVETTYVTWKRKPLLNLFGKRKRLAKLTNFMIGRDIIKKLYSLNTRHFNARGFHYDIRLPCVISLRDDVMERKKKRQEPGSPAAGTPAGRRHKKLGKKANEHYARLFARRMSERITMLKDRKEPLIRQIKS